LLRKLAELKMGGPSRIVESLRAALEKQVSREFASDIFEPEEPLIPEEELEQRRSELRNGPTDMQRLFLFAKLIKFLSRHLILCGDAGVRLPSAEDAANEASLNY